MWASKIVRAVCQFASCLENKPKRISKSQLKFEMDILNALFAFTAHHIRFAQFTSLFNFLRPKQIQSNRKWLSKCETAKKKWQIKWIAEKREEKRGNNGWENKIMEMWYYSLPFVLVIFWMAGKTVCNLCSNIFTKSNYYIFCLLYCCLSSIIRCIF